MNNTKSIILVAAIGLISFTSKAQMSNNTPQAVQTAFSAKYPQAQVKKWKTKKDTSIAIFMMNGKKYKASYAPDGSWLNTARNLKNEASLPVQTRSYLKTGTYASWHIDDMEKVHKPGMDWYEVYVDNNSGNPSATENAGSVSDRMLCFDANGKLTKVVRL